MASKLSTVRWSSLGGRTCRFIAVAVLAVTLTGVRCPLVVHAASLAVGDLLVGGENGRIYHYDADGTSIDVWDTKSEQTFNSGLAEEGGMCFDASLDVYSTNFDASSMTEFDSTGTILVNPWASGFNTKPESCVRDSAGNFYVGSVDPGDIRKFSPTGALVATYSPTGQTRGADWMALASDQCTMYYTSEGSSVLRYDVCTSTQLSDFADLSESECTGLALRPGGDVILACPDATGSLGQSGVLHLDASGHVLQVYTASSINQVAPFAIALAGDGSSFWVGDALSGAVSRVDIDTGRVLLHFQAPTPLVGGVSVVPGPVQGNPNYGAALPPAQDELVVCGNAPVSGPVSPSSTPCARAVAGAVLDPVTSQVGQTSTQAGQANAYAAAGGITVAGRDAPPDSTLQVQFEPASSLQPCTAQYWTGTQLPPAGAAILGQVSTDNQGNYASAGALLLPTPTATGTAQVCVVQPPVTPGGPPSAGETVTVSIVSGTGPGTCLQANAPLTAPPANQGTFAAAVPFGWEGTPSSHDAVGGVYSKIANYDPYTDATGGDVTSWTMLRSASPHALAQVGWQAGPLHFPPGTPPQTFVEYIDFSIGLSIFESGSGGGLGVSGGINNVNPFLGDAVVGDSDYYTTLFNPETGPVVGNGPSPGVFTFMVDNAVVAEFPGTFVPTDAYVKSEVHSGADQVAGGVSDHEHFTDTWAYWPAGPVASGSTGGWHSFDGMTVARDFPSVISSYTGASTGNPGAGSTVDVWDVNCAM